MSKLICGLYEECESTWCAHHKPHDEQPVLVPTLTGDALEVECTMSTPCESVHANCACVVWQGEIVED